MKKEKTMCSGCYNNDYNHGLGGAKECWNFSEAKVVDKLAIHVDEPPPYDKTKAKPLLSCYQQRRMCFVDPKVLREDGYWKY
jgi:hypothetical protein